MSSITLLRPGMGLGRTARQVIEAQIEELIALLDAADGDPDLEDDDPSGDPLDIDGEEPGDDGQPLMAMLPVHGIDQTKGPINEREASLEHLAAELGLIRTPTGGWRHPS